MLKKNKNDEQNMTTMTRVIDNKTIHCKSIIDGFASMFNRQNRWPDNHPKAVEWVDRSGKNIKTSLSEFESRLASKPICQVQKRNPTLVTSLSVLGGTQPSNFAECLPSQAVYADMV